MFLKAFEDGVTLVFAVIGLIAMAFCIPLMIAFMDWRNGKKQPKGIKL